MQYDVLQNKLKNVLIPSLSAAAIHVVDKTPLSETPKVIEPIPEPPQIPEESVEIVNQLNNLGEATFASLGLGGWSPIGIVQNSFEYLHITLGVPWWGAIVIGNYINCCYYYIHWIYLRYNCNSFMYVSLGDYCSEKCCQDEQLYAAAASVASKNV